MFTLKVETDNAAFAADMSGEITSILAQVIGALKTDKHADTIRDSNGNTVGHWSLTTGQGDAERAAMIEKARDAYATDDIEIDSDAEASIGDNGAWVQAWVYLANDEYFEEEEETDDADDDEDATDAAHTDEGDDEPQDDESEAAS